LFLDLLLEDLELTHFLDIASVPVSQPALEHLLHHEECDQDIHGEVGGESWWVLGVHIDTDPEQPPDEVVHEVAENEGLSRVLYGRSW